MRSLDCHDVGATYASLASILEADVEAIRSAVSEFAESVDPEEFPSGAWRELPHVMLSKAGLQLPPVVVGETFWFHATRTLDPESFRRRGVLTRPEIQDVLWEALGRVAGVDERTWSDFRARLIRGELGESGSMYLHKEHRANDGPYALLVREAAFAASTLNAHDYLALPEIVQEIAWAAASDLGVDLAAAFTVAARPAIVKFRVNGLRRESIEAALWYVYEKTRTDTIPSAANECFVSETGTIPPEDIVAVEIL